MRAAPVAPRLPACQPVEGGQHHEEPVGAGVQVEPFLVGGVGLRRLSTEGSIEGAPSATDPLVSFGGGFRTLLSDRWHLRLEARDHLSVYEGADGDRPQHDVAVSVGLGVRP